VLWVYFCAASLGSMAACGMSVHDSSLRVEVEGGKFTMYQLLRLGVYVVVVKGRLFFFKFPCITYSDDGGW